ncbi:MAG: DDE-type integrase/transposase/recombinase, partial [Acidimicrobiales bacterium]
MTDFTYVATWAGFVYVAFAIDLFSRAIVGWSIATVKDVAFVEACLKMAIWRRDHHGCQWPCCSPRWWPTKVPTPRAVSGLICADRHLLAGRRRWPGEA